MVYIATKITKMQMKLSFRQNGGHNNIFRTDNTFQVKGTGRGQIYSGKHIFVMSFISPFTLKHQYPHYPYSLLYISFSTDKENLFTDLSFLGW